MTLQALTANRLADGIVVFLSEGGQWLRSIERARLAEGEEAATALLAEGERAAAEGLVVAPYLIEVERTQHGPRPRRYRERLRAEGPSVPFGRAAL